jgi:hypothetical protein
MNLYQLIFQKQSLKKLTQYPVHEKLNSKPFYAYQ